MSMEKHKCKLCSRKFSSGKAMGGHMRSHLRTLPLPPKTPPQKQDSAGGRSESTLSLHSLKEEEEEEEIREEKYLGYGLRENPKKSCKIVDPEFLDGAGSVVVHDNESETESTKKPTRRRSKRTRRMFISEQEAVVVKKEKSAEFEPEPEPVSSFSDTSPEEDIAICLMMLSKDVWRSSYESDESKFRNQKQGKYQCEICNKMLKSSQALGSHKTVHKKNNSCIEDKNEGIKSKENSRQLRMKNVDQKLHECPFCGKLYGSGQALGGHKRSHLLSSSTTASSSSKVGDSLMDSSSAKFPNGFIDLNMPAPIEDEDFSQPEVSGVS
ncbi:PREDICTED: zinc finger protein ZAT4-like [Nicotiana attenuata]|uniref:Zinc finger protein zat9 n=1 Tax=Nicotiana attenuata TaxID=49451 RepID=A0A1J6KWJ4_NICAT|nr:PREDICTED: zinc finger protein ZAT4-like [Nicotiana attenuata]OIT27107.1 zinc finger protein zat9 [Nicotiana attenuata]